MDKCNRKLVGPFLSIHQAMDEHEQTIGQLKEELLETRRAAGEEQGRRQSAEEKAAQLEEQLKARSAQLEEQLKAKDEQLAELQAKLAQKDQELSQVKAWSSASQLLQPQQLNTARAQAAGRPQAVHAVSQQATPHTVTTTTTYKTSVPVHVSSASPAPQQPAAPQQAASQPVAAGRR